MRILVVGDIVGRPGRTAVRRVVPTLRKDLDLDLVIANGENAAGGRGITRETAEELLTVGVDALTGGNHTLAIREVYDYLNNPDAPVLRPLNYPPGVPGRGWLRLGPIVVVNLMGRVFMQCLDNPFSAIDCLLKEVETSQGNVPVIVDMHAEATSEKATLGWYLDGRVGAVVGTHTHVPTADCRVLPGGTAYVADVGMVGPRDSVLGLKIDRAVEHLLKQMPLRTEVARGTMVFNSVLIEIDLGSSRAISITRVDRILEPE